MGGPDWPQALMLTAEVAEAVRLVLTQKLLQNLKFGVRAAARHNTRHTRAPRMRHTRAPTSPPHKGAINAPTARRPPAPPPPP
eukprot:1736278-Prymnesium_polylepis.2